MIDIRRYCLCGASWVGRLARHNARIQREQWDREHAGPGHEKIDRKAWEYNKEMRQICKKLLGQ